MSADRRRTISHFETTSIPIPPRSPEARTHWPFCYVNRRDQSRDARARHLSSVFWDDSSAIG
ncbi:hypothetical protein CERSUDRAFT_84636 [Gelatoporia subvermispora B]|uniref:Uncharacterized protein n=1 Tax=Ceriporiopsis subvermispora (strain B) TaxID=914234 RepID=M2RDG4_CERS8|nr:hypothetical protein CERSUDRAFT_84636 [Gelatoporia subvermispora B]